MENIITIQNLNKRDIPLIIKMMQKKKSEHIQKHGYADMDKIDFFESTIRTLSGILMNA